MYILLILSSFFSFTSTLSTKNYYFTFSKTELEIKVGEDLYPYLEEIEVNYYENNIIDNTNLTIKYGVEGTTVDSITTNVVGDYLLVIQATKQTRKQNQSIIIHVIDDISPSFIKVPKFVMEYKGDKPNYEQGVTFSDNYNYTSELDLSIDDSNVVYSKLGTYEVYYTLTDTSYNKAVDKTTVEIIDTKPPVIVAENFISTYGEEVDYLKHYDATDNYDGNIKDKVKIKSNVNIYQQGTYEVVYSVFDSSLNYYETKYYVTIVDDRLYKIVFKLDVLVFNKNQTEEVDYLENVLGVYKGKELVNRHITVDDSSVNYAKEGKYNVSYYIVENEIYYKNDLTVYIKSPTQTNPQIISTPPAIIGQSRNIYINEEFNPLLNVNAFDYLGNDISDKIMIVSSNVNTSEEGLYYIIYEVYDSNGQFAREQLYYNVIKRREESIVESVTTIDNDEQIDEIVINDSSNIFYTIAKSSIYFIVGMLILYLFFNYVIFKKK